MDLLCVNFCILFQTPFMIFVVSSASRILQNTIADLKFITEGFHATTR